MHKKDAQAIIRRHFGNSIQNATANICVAATVCLEGEERHDLIRRQAAILSQIMAVMGQSPACTFDELVEGMHELTREMRAEMPEELVEVVTSL